jgi:tripartite-type tricarboxylate transporter receptor subunit TctC
MHVWLKPTAVFAFATGMLVCVHCALAQQYPARPIRIVAASTPSSGPDVITRLIAQKLVAVRPE